MDYKSELALLLNSAQPSLSASELEEMLEIPPDAAMGDYALPCFKLAKTLRMAPPKIAADLLKKFQKPGWISKVEIAGGYLNFFVDRAFFAQSTLSAVGQQGERYGSSQMGEGRAVTIDYSSINIAKPFHIGHLSSTAIGHALYNIYNFLGFHCVGINHLGDWGTQFGKLIAAYKRWGNREDVEKRSIQALLELYVRFHEEAKQDAALDDEGRAWFKKIEDGDEEALSIFGWFKELTLKEVSKVYDLLGIHFDSYAGESFYNDKMQPVIDELKAKNLLEESDGAQIVRLDDYELPPCLILRSDGATLYATRDLAAAFYRKKTYDFYKNLYVVAYQQNLHFRQLFQVLELMGADFAKDCVHVAFGMVSLADGTISTREGRVVFLEDVLNSAIEKTRSVIQEKNPNLENKDEIAKKVGVGAVVFSVLSGSRIKDITFDLDRLLNFDGETGPYVQYTHARACSLLRKAGEAYTAAPDYTALACDQAFAVLRLIQEFPGVIVKAAEKYEPFMITRQVVSLAQAFNKFYYDIRILDEQDPAGTAARLALVDATRTVIKTGLALIGIDAPEQM
jgi:arginyl-tRNA synthetase